MTDIFREIEDDLRRDKYAKLFNRFGPALIILAVIIVVAVAGWRYWTYQQSQSAQAAGGRFEQALDLARDGKEGDAEAILKDLAAAAPAGYRDLARFRLAGEVGKRDAAAGADAYDALANDASLSSSLRDLATLRAAILRLDSANRQDLEQKLTPLAAPGKPWRHTAREILGLAALKANDYEAAGRWFDEIASDAEAPSGLRQRVDLYLALVRGGPVQAQ
jgi:hypothetical protein